jgi:hypothetical protein
MDALRFRPEAFDSEVAIAKDSGVAWDQWGVAYVKWLQAALNTVRKTKLAVTGVPDRQMMSALQSMQAKMGKYPRMGRVGAWTTKALAKAGAPPTRPAPPGVGVDINFDARKHLACFQNAKWLGVPISYIVRYYSGGAKTYSKDLRPDEAKALTKVGIKIVTVWEIGANASGRAQGLNAGAGAAIQAARCGQPTGTPIYFAIDHDPPAAQRTVIEQYFKGIRDGLKGRHAIGVYGNRTTLDWCKAQGIVTWFWQSCSTLTANGTNQFRWPGVNLHQVKCEDAVCNVHVDWNESDGREGGWFVAGENTSQFEFPEYDLWGGT